MSLSNLKIIFGSHALLLLMQLETHLNQEKEKKRKSSNVHNAESWNIMYVLYKLILVLLLLPSPSPSRALLSLRLGAVGGANSSQLCVSLRGHKDRSVTLAKINLASVPSTLIITRRLRLESKPRVAPHQPTALRCETPPRWFESVNGYEISGVALNASIHPEGLQEEEEEEEAGTRRPDFGVWLKRPIRFAEPSPIVGAHQLCFPLNAGWHSHWLPHSLTHSLLLTLCSLLFSSYYWGKKVRKEGERKGAGGGARNFSCEIVTHTGVATCRFLKWPHDYGIYNTFSAKKM